MNELYLDNAATTKPWPSAVNAVQEALQEAFGNASSVHRRGLEAARRISAARESIKSICGGGDWQVVFTSGGSESDTTAILGTAPRGKRNRIVTTTLEHAAVEQACQRAREHGAVVVEIPAGHSGVVDPLRIAEVVDRNTALVTVTHVASEMGTVQDVAEIGRQVKNIAPRCLVHVDAVQAPSQLPELNYPEEIDMVSLSAHKIHGPQGIGALLLRSGARPRPLICGGDQQNGLRPGTLNLPGIIGFAAAADDLIRRRGRDIPRMRELTDRLIARALEIDGVNTLGNPRARAAGIAILAIDGVPSEVLLHALESRGVLASAGSACHAGRREPPRCLVQAGLTPAQGTLRFSLSFDTTTAQIDCAALHLKESVVAVRRQLKGAS